MLAGVLLILRLTLPLQNVALENPMELSPEMKEFIDTKVERSLPPAKRLQSLLTAINQGEGPKFTYAPVSRTAAETFTNRNGNCLSFTLMFVSMARYLSLDARFREVVVPPVFMKSGEFVKLSQHLNAAVFIGGETYAVDVFPEVVPIQAGGQIVSDERGLAHFFSNKAADELGDGNYNLADSYLKRALEIDATTVGAWVNLGAARARAGNYDEAERSYRKALQLDPKNLAAMNNLANIFDLTGRTKESLRLQKKVAEFRDKNPYYHFNLGLQAFAQGNYQEALARYKRAIKLKCKDPSLYQAIARVYSRTGQNQKASENLKLAEKYASSSEKQLAVGSRQ